MTQFCVPEGKWLGIVDGDKNVKRVFSAKNSLDFLSVAFYFAAFEFDYAVVLHKKTLMISGNHLFVNHSLDFVISENATQKFCSRDVALGSC